MSEATYDDYENKYDCDEEYEHDFFEDFDWCYECTGYGDDYFINDEGELECACPTCPHNTNRYDDDWDD